MACPYFNNAPREEQQFVNFQGGHTVAEVDDDDGQKREEQGNDADDGELLLLTNGVNKAAVLSDQISYGGYLQLDKLLSCQKLHSNEEGKLVPEEHLFIIIHQTYELWFKQIIFDLDQVRTLLDNKIVDERKTLQIVSLLERTAKILKLLVDQILILETMSPLDFVEFRRYLTSASGFQSLQFRVLENKLGVIPKNRVSYNYQHYREVFHNEGDRQIVAQSEEEPSLFVLIDRWLARTPGIYEEEFVEQSGAQSDDDDDDEDKEEVLDKEHMKNDGEKHKNRKKMRKTFWGRYLQAVEQYLEVMRLQAEEPTQTKKEQRLLWEEYVKIKKSFDTITDEQNYNSYVQTGERRLSHNALKGALMIYFYRDMPRFSQPYQILFYLMDIDSLLQKWRYNHLMLVQRMLGSKMGSGGSSGYMYLRSTVSDRYKVFLDLFNLSTWLIPRNYIPKLSPKMVKTLSGTQI